MYQMVIQRAWELALRGPNMGYLRPAGGRVRRMSDKIQIDLRKKDNVKRKWRTG